MFYQVNIETTEKFGKNGKNREYFELDKTDLAEIEERIITPYLRGDEFQFDGYFLSKKDIRRLSVKSTRQTTTTLSKVENDNMPSNILMFVSPTDIVGYKSHTTDITNEVFDRVKAKIASSNTSPKQPSTIARTVDRSKVFIVHGRDDLAKVSTARFIEKLGLSAIILHEQVSAGLTIIEKIEEHTNVGFAIVLYTPCDLGSLNGETPKPRARQNVVFEHGYLIGKLGRRNVCALVKSGVEVPNDVTGVVYVPLDENQAWHLAIAKELRNAGYDIDMNKAV